MRYSLAACVAQLALGDTTNALGSYRKLAERMPGQAAPLVKLANVQIAAKDLPGARKTLLDALRIKPDFLDAQLMLGGVEVPTGVSEFNYAGAIRSEPVKVVKSTLTGLPIMANAEIVLEGWIMKGDTSDEGPFGEWTGYYASDMRPEPVLDIKAIYYRDNPIILGCPPQRPPDELARYRAVTRSALIRENITRAGVPDVKAAWAHEVGTARMLVAVAIKQRYPGHARQAGHIACQCHVGAYAGKYVVVVDEDIDVSNLEELTWAMLTRSDPATSIDIITNAWSTPLDPRIPPEEKDKGNTTNSRAIIDACRPFHWRDKFPKVNMPTPEKMREARKKFGYLLD